MVKDSSWGFLALHSHYRNGFLPFRGGLMEQPHAYIEAMQVIDSEVHSDS